MLSRLAVLLAALVPALSSVAATNAAAQSGPITWKTELFNPKGKTDDFIVPIPCGGGMTFRRVKVPTTGGALADRRVRLGWSNPETGYSDYIHDEYLQGGLSEAGVESRFYYIGKYEVTRDQYDAVMSPQCPTPKPSGKVPKVELSWFDAVEFSRRLNEWIGANAPDHLPMESGARAFLRLPTEVEWEYAARGGAEVQEGAFRERLPLKAPLKTYGWYEGAESSNGKVRPIGLLDPTPLDLYDMMGNAEEIVFEPYYLNRAGRRHGAPGGFVTRGGSVKEPENRFRTAMRREYSYFESPSNKALRTQTSGLRLVISAPAEVDGKRIEAIRKDWSEVTAQRNAGVTDPLSIVRELAKSSSDHAIVSSLETVEMAIVQDQRIRNELEERALRQSLFVGGIMVRTLRENDQRLRQLKIALDTVTGLGDAEMSTGIQSQMEEAKSRLRLTSQIYVQTLFQVADRLREDRLNEQVNLLSRELGGSSQGDLVPFVQTFARESAGYSRRPVTSEEELVRRTLQ